MKKLKFKFFCTIYNKEEENKMKAGFVTYAKEFQKGFFHVKIRISKMIVIDTIWYDNIVNNDLQSGQYVMKNRMIVFELQDAKTKSGKEFSRLINVRNINMEKFHDRITYYTRYQQLKQIEEEQTTKN